ncbi:pyrroline-5-carboxylate reductase [Candidatus Peregrinibacteria bacterium]|nr:pyrroline-5-carboxylate reductase [Candidatus Peregrinibacteria bacterium]
MKKICIVGIGNMGGAIAEFLNGKYEIVECRKTDDPNEKMALCGTVIVAVKPQSFAEFAETVTIDLKDKLIISIMAGVTIENIRKKLGAVKIVRIFPNLPLKIGQALTIWKCGKDVSDEEKNFVQEILRNFGEEMEVGNEEDIAVLGALSACGPAYFAYIAEQIKKSALQHGYSQGDAEKIAMETFAGSANLMKRTGWTPEELRAKITSKGGTTEAAIGYMESKKIGEIFLEGIEAGIKRTKKLNG